MLEARHTRAFPSTHLRALTQPDSQVMGVGDDCGGGSRGGKEHDRRDVVIRLVQAQLEEDVVARRGTPYVVPGEGDGVVLEPCLPVAVHGIILNGGELQGTAATTAGPLLGGPLLGGQISAPRTRYTMGPPSSSYSTHEGACWLTRHRIMASYRLGGQRCSAQCQRWPGIPQAWLRREGMIAVHISYMYVSLSRGAHGHEAAS